MPIYKNNYNYTQPQNANNIVYDNATSGLTSNRVRSAIDELAEGMNDIKSELLKTINFSSTTDGAGRITIDVPTGYVPIYATVNQGFSAIITGNILRIVESDWNESLVLSYIKYYSYTPVTGTILFIKTAL